MGLRGPGALRRLEAATPKEKKRKRRLPWEAKGLSRVAKVVKFLEWLPITKGMLAGRRMRLLPEQRQFIERVYGTVTKDGRRLASIAIQSEPKGNGKTGLVAGLCLCHLLGPEAEPRGEVYSAAIDRNQAGIIFQEMEAIIFAVPEFAARVNVQRFHKKIEDYQNGSTYEALSSDARSAHGRAPSLWAYDELAQETNPALLENLMQGMSKRNESLGVIISTQAPNDDHPLSELIDDAIANPDDKRTVLQLTAAPAEANVFDLDVLKACNPAWGKFLNVKDLMDKRDRAMRNPSQEAGFRNLRANQRVDARVEKRLVTTEVWSRGKQAVEDPMGRRCFGGLDLSAKHDLTAYVKVYEDANGVFDIVAKFWTPQGQLEGRKEQEKRKFKLWIEQGWLTAVPGDVIDLAFVAAEVAKDRTKVERVGYDRWKIDDFKSELSKIGVKDTPRNPKNPDPDEFWLQPFGQGFKDMGFAVDHFVELALGGKLRHGGNPVLSACVANCIVVSDPAGNQKVDKAKSNRAGSIRIDGAVATLIALGTAKRFAAKKPKPSIDEFLKNPVMVV